jgi:Type II CAAX prenyl endopeptidase Rce1-like
MSMQWFTSATDTAVSIIADPYAALFCALGISFVLLSSVLNVRNLVKNAGGDFTPVMTYFASVFGLLFLLPLAVILLRGGQTGVSPLSMGLGPGNWKLGLTLTVIFLPFSLLGLWLGINDPELKTYYPFSKEAMSSTGRFALYESAYLVLYYLPWEFTFRGVILFSLLALLPHTVPALVVVVMVSTFLSTIFHIGHPNSEVLGAFLLGVIAGTITAVTGSFLYALFHHALVGILNDCIAYRGRMRTQRLGRETA